MEVIDNKEFSLLNEIFKAGFKKAAESFSSLTSHKVSLTNTVIQTFDHIDEMRYAYGSAGVLTAVQTNLIGELKGESYLFFTREEKQIIAKMTTQTMGGMEMDEDSVCKEIDNILSAAVITELSNILGITIYGDVPLLTIVDGPEDVLQNQMTEAGTTFISVRSRFIFDAIEEINPLFIWKFESKLVSFLSK